MKSHYLPGSARVNQCHLLERLLVHQGAHQTVEEGKHQLNKRKIEKMSVCFSIMKAQI